MKLIKNLTLNNVPIPLVKEHVALDTNTPGRADFTVQSKEPLSGIVHLCIGDASRGVMVDFFTGYIERSTTVDALQQRLFCRELSAILWKKTPVSARNVSLNDVLAIYSRKLGLEFVQLKTEYATTRKPVFQTVASGIHGMYHLGNVFKIPNYIWQQQADGTIFAGAYEDSRWAGKDFPIAEELFQDVQLDGSKTIQALPGLRPGVKINGRYLTSLQFEEHKMVLTCEKRLDVS